MFSFQRTLWGVGFAALALALLVAAVTFAVRQPSEPREIVTARTVLDRIADQYFVVTKSAFINQESEIVVDQGSKWSNLLWGQTVTARGVIRLDLGVNLNQLTEDEIVVDNRSRTVKVDLPPADILDASQYGDIEVDSSQGVLKYLFDNDPNEDHNRALQQLIADAKEAVRQDSALFEDARQDSRRLLQLIVENMGYQLVVSE